MELLRDSDIHDLDRGKLELADHCMMDGGPYVTVAGALALVSYSKPGELVNIAKVNGVVWKCSWRCFHKQHQRHEPWTIMS
jgi:hypothetical protein